MLTSSAKSKLILAGEHGVLYGTPAITTSLAWSTRCQWSFISNSQQVQLADGQVCDWTSDNLAEHWQVLSQRHERWMQAPDTKILTSLCDLPLAVLAWWQQHFSLLPVSCVIRSDIPMGHGLGSSASLIVAMLRGLLQVHQQSFSDAELQSAATTLENLAHGKSSGLDVAAVMQDGCLLWQSSKVVEVLQSVAVPGYLVNTGKPVSQTSDCVRHVRHHHHDNEALWQNMMTQVSLAVHALTHHHDQLFEPITQLQSILTTLGVVPSKVQAFTDQIRAFGWTGKQCGAGSVDGDGGGFYWLLATENPQAVCDAYGFEVWPLSSITSGCSL
jgi:mevalonate kinase